MRARHMQPGNTYEFRPDEEGGARFVKVESVEVDGEEVYVRGTWWGGSFDADLPIGLGVFDFDDPVRQRF